MGGCSSGVRFSLILVFLISRSSATAEPANCTISDKNSYTITPTTSSSARIVSCDGFLDLSKGTQEEVDALLVSNEVTEIQANLMLMNSSIKRLQFQNAYLSAKPSAAGHVRGKIFIQRNKFLENIEVDVEFEKSVITNYQLTGNVLLKMNKNFEKIIRRDGSVKGNFQEEGECEFPDDVRDFVELVGCKYVRGDLRLENTIGDEVPANLSFISGCLRIIGTNLKNLRFYLHKSNGNETCQNGKKSEISGNKELFIHPGLKKVLLTSFGGKIDFDETIEATCIPSEVLFDTNTCYHLDGNYVMSGDSYKGGVQNLQRIKKIKGSFIVKKTDLKTLDVPELISIGNSASDEPAISFIDNGDLVSVTFPKLNSLVTNGDVVVSLANNKNLRLPKETIENFKKLARGKQLECDFSKAAVTDLDELEPCTAVTGDLSLKGTKGKTSSKIFYITGCLTIIDSDLEDLTFIALDGSKPSNCGGKSEIKGNKKLCLKWSDLGDIQKKFGHKIEYKADESCELSCSEAEFHEQESVCEQFNGDLTITKAPSGSLLSLMKRVKKIVGKVTISGENGMEIEFPELISVDNSKGNGEAISIDGKKEIKRISFPNLKKLEVKDGEKAISVKGYKMEKETAEIFHLAADGKEFSLECDFSNAALSSLEELDYCSRVAGDLILEKTKDTKTNAVVSSISGCLRIIDTELKGNLAFLAMKTPSPSAKCSNGENSEVKGNKNLCLSSPRILDILTAFGQEISFSFDDACPLSCKLDEYIKDDRFCRELEGDFAASGRTSEEEERRRSDPKSIDRVAKKVRKIHGAIVLDKTQHAEIEFPELISIENSAGGPALIVTENDALQKLSFPKLIALGVGGDTAVLIDKNDGFRLSDELGKVLQKAANGKKIFYQCHESKEISDVARMSGCTRWSSGIHFASSFKGIPSSKIEYFAGCLKMENTLMETIDFLELKEKSGGGCQENSIQNNSNLCVPRLKSKELQTMISSSLSISGNKPTEECPCSAVGGSISDIECSVVKGELQIDGNCTSDTRFSLVKEIRGSLSISNCSLSSVKEIFPVLKNISATTGVALNLEGISGDLNLSELKDLKLESKEDVVLRIQTQKQIPYMDVADLKLVFGEKRVKVENEEEVPQGVCIFYSPPAEVKNCKKIAGDLLLDEKTKKIGGEELKEVTGCLQMKKTNIDYGFLTKIEKTGEKCRWKEGRTEMSEIGCIPYKIRKNVKEILSKEVTKEENKKGCNECSSLQSGAKCHVVVGDLVLDGKTKEQEMAGQLAEIHEVYGRVVIKGSSLKNIAFPKLERIESDSAEPVLEVMKNTELVKLEMPGLRNISSNGRLLVKMADNPKLKKTDSLMTTLKTITGSECKDPKDPVCHFSESKAVMPTPQPSKEDEGKEGGEEKKEEEGMSSTTIGLIIVGVLVGVVLVAGIIGFFVMRKKGGKKDGKKTKEQGKGGKGKKKKTSKGKEGKKTKEKSPAETTPDEGSKAVESAPGDPAVPQPPEAPLQPPADAAPQQPPPLPEAVPLPAAPPAAAPGDDYFNTPA